MGMVVMSKRELNRLNVLARLDSELSASASSNLGIAASILVSWSRSTAQSIAGLRFALASRASNVLSGRARLEIGCASIPSTSDRLRVGITIFPRAIKIKAPDFGVDSGECYCDRVETAGGVRSMPSSATRTFASLADSPTMAVRLSPRP
jgi:hypothetical protein